MVTIYFNWIIRFRIRLKRKRYPIQIQKIPNIWPDWTPKSGSCTPLVPASRTWWSAHIWVKQIWLKIQQRQRNAKWFQSLLLPLSGSFNSTKFKGFCNISGRLVAARWSPTAKILLAARSFNLSGPPKIRTISGPCHLYTEHFTSNDGFKS